jgi:hypothetical protein
MGHIWSIEGSNDYEWKTREEDNTPKHRNKYIENNRPWTKRTELKEKIIWIEEFSMKKYISAKDNNG